MAKTRKDKGEIKRFVVFAVHVTSAPSKKYYPRYFNTNQAWQYKKQLMDRLPSWYAIVIFNRRIGVVVSNVRGSNPRYSVKGTKSVFQTPVMAGSTAG
jgi:hypothetical protein